MNSDTSFSSDSLTSSRPNILWISLEDTSPRLGCYGDKLARTPHIDALAEQGILYRNAFSTAPVCAPSRAAVITGCFATAIGAQHMRTTTVAPECPGLPPPYQAVPPPHVRCFTEYLGAAGYYCCNNGKTDYQFAPLLLAWDAIGWRSEIDAIHWRHRPDPAQPFFAVFNLEDTHENATVFRNAFTVNPTCSPSRCALLTGQYAHQCGMLGLAHRGFHMPDYSLHLAHVLGKVGYNTALAGIQHETDDTATLSSCYQNLLDAEPLPPAVGPNNMHRDRIVAERAAEFLGRKHDRPFFLSVGFFSTHRAFPKVEHSSQEIQAWPTVPDCPETRQDLAGYQASLDILDECIGRVFTALEETGRDRDTLVICTTDHGPAFPFMKCTLRDDGVAVMLLLRLPGQAEGQHNIDAMVTQLDIFPTVMDLLRMESPHPLDGASLLPLIRKEKTHIHNAVFAEVNFHAAYEPQRSVRTLAWKYIRRYPNGNDRCILGY